MKENPGLEKYSAFWLVMSCAVLFAKNFSERPCGKFPQFELGLC